MMETAVKIRNLDELLQPFFNRNIRVTEYSTRRLTAAGENYGSLMLQLEIKLKGENNQEETLNVVAKMCPPNEWLKKMFNTAFTFKKEIAIYKIIFPTLRSFQEEQGVLDPIDCFPRCYGARISLDPTSDTVDDDAVLLLENLKLSSFAIADRMKGFDLNTIRLVLRDLAVFHAVPIALKFLKPDIFHTKVLPHLQKLQAFDTLSEETEKSMTDTIINYAKVNQDCAPLLPRVEKALHSCLQNLKTRPPPREPLATINHNDYWVNNTLIKYENNKPVKNKMVDFQLIDYGSPANDIVFLLFSSVQKEVLDKYYDELINLYYDTFIATLNDLKCDTKPFTLKLLQEEIEDSAKTTQFFHVMVMLRPIFTMKGTVKEISELSEADLLTDEHLSEEYKQKVPEKILEFARRDWI